MLKRIFLVFLLVIFGINCLGLVVYKPRSSLKQNSTGNINEVSNYYYNSDNDYAIFIELWDKKQAYYHHYSEEGIILSSTVSENIQYVENLFGHLETEFVYLIMINNLSEGNILIFNPKKDITGLKRLYYTGTLEKLDIEKDIIINPEERKDFFAFSDNLSSISSYEDFFKTSLIVNNIYFNFYKSNFLK